MNKRVNWIDTAKGIGIILVVYGHISYRPEWFYMWLGSFHMPLFFFLSGITYNHEKYSDFKVFIKNKIQTLVIPYFIFSVITLLWDTAWKVFYHFKDGASIGIKPIIRSVIAIVVQIRGTSYGIGVWFIPCIFVAFILLHFILKAARGNKAAALIIASCCLVAGYLYCTYINIKLPWGIDAAFVAVFFMTIGSVFRERLLTNTKIPIIVGGGVFFLINLAFAWLNYRVLGRSVGMWSNNYGNFVYFVCGALSGIAFIRLISEKINIPAIMSIGKHSIYYYGLHILLIELFTKQFMRINLENDAIAFIMATIEMAVTLGILALCRPLYDKLYNKIIGITDRPRLK